MKLAFIRRRQSVARIRRPRGGGYCDAINATRPWLSLTFGPTLVMTLVALWARRLPWLVVGFALLMCGALIANATVANSLVSALTI